MKSIKEQLTTVQKELNKLQSMINDIADKTDDEKIYRPDARQVWSLKSSIEVLIQNYFTPSFYSPEDYDFMRKAIICDDVKEKLSSINPVKTNGARN